MASTSAYTTLAVWRLLTQSEILWIATARRRHVQLTVAEHWLVEKHSHALESLTLRLVCGHSERWTVDVLETAA